MDDRTMEVFLAAKKNGELVFGADVGETPARTFYSWSLCPDGSYVQGEQDEKGNFDGRVIKIIPKDQIQIKRVRKEKNTSSCITIFNDGEKEFSSWQGGEKNGD